VWNDPARESYELAVANRLFAEQRYEFEAPFLALARETYRAPLEDMDFRGASEAARVRINDWVAERTRDRIRDLIPAGGVDDTTRMVLTNAIYFRARWMTQFDPNATHEAEFFAPSGTVRTPTMYLDGELSIGSVDGVQILEMPYVGDELSMWIVLPDSRTGLAALEQSMSPERIASWASALQRRQVQVALPKVTIDPPEPIDLASALGEMGMRDAFTPRVADFTAMANPQNPDERLYISAVFHEAFVAIDEEGTEAAAATAVVMAEGDAAMPDGVPFIADHPFLFLIRDQQSGAILFLGRVVDPS
jgi:serpin B